MSVSVDDNGVKHLYTPVSGGESWIAKQGVSWWNDPRVLLGGHVNNIIRNSDGTYGSDGNDEARISITTSSGYNSSKIVKDFSKLDIDKGGRGYMQDPNDWKNTEWGFYFNVSNWSSADQITLYLRGGRHYNPPSVSCEGFSYKIDVDFSNGKTRFAKESWHVHYDFTTWANALNLGSLKNKWIGMKVVCYNVKIGDATAVNAELYIDPDGLDSSFKPANNWQKADSFQDSGGFGSGGNQCGGKSDQIGNWGGPLAAFRWDNISSGGIKFMYLHVFEIDPLNIGGGGGGVPPPIFTPSCPNSAEDPVPTSQVAIISKHRFNLGDFDNPEHCAFPGE